MAPLPRGDIVTFIAAMLAAIVGGYVTYIIKHNRAARAAAAVITAACILLAAVLAPALFFPSPTTTPPANPPTATATSLLAAAPPTTEILATNTQPPMPQPTDTQLPLTPTAVIPPTNTQPPQPTLESPPSATSTIVPFTPQQQEVVIDTVTVQGNALNGNEYQIQQAGSYAVEIESGAYSPWGDDTVKNGQWRAFAYIYKNRGVKRGDSTWGSNVPITPDFIVGCEIDMGSRSKAEECGIGARSNLGTLEPGDKLLFVAMDERQAYSENRDSLKVKIIKLP
jgi:hypothetical protein